MQQVLSALIFWSALCQAQDGEGRLYDAVVQNDVASFSEILKQHPEFKTDSRVGEKCLILSLRHQASDPALEKMVLDVWRVPFNDNAIFQALKCATDRSDTRALSLLLHTRALQSDRTSSMRSALDAAMGAPDDSMVRHLVEKEKLFEVVAPSDLLGTHSDWIAGVVSHSSAPLGRLTEYAPEIWKGPSNGLFFAVAFDQPGAFNSILRRFGGRDGGFALERAVKDGRFEYVKPLLEGGADANTIRIGGDSSQIRESQALPIAVRKGELGVVLDLLSHGAIPNETAYGYAFINHDDRLFETLVGTGLIPNRIENDSIAAYIFQTIARSGNWKLMKQYLMSATFPRMGIIDVTTPAVRPTSDSSLLARDPELFTILQIMGASVEFLGTRLSFLDAETKLKRTIEGARAGNLEASLYLARLQDQRVQLERAR